MKRLLPLLVACAPPPEPVEPPTAVDTPSFALSTLSFSRSEDGVTAGFDLDESTASRCGIDDLVTADGTPGIDNSFAELVPLIELAGGQIDDIIAASVVSGELLYVIEWNRPADDPTGCEELTITRTHGPPMRSVSGELVPGQTLRRSGEHPAITVDCEAVGPDHLRAQGFDLPVEFEILGVELALTLSDATVEARVEGEQVTGVLGGGLPMDQLATLTSSIGGIGPELAVLLGDVLQTRADLGDDGAGGCTAMSAAMHIAGIPAFTFDGSFDSGLP